MKHKPLTPACPCGAPITWPQFHATGLCSACNGAIAAQATQPPKERSAA